MRKYRSSLSDNWILGVGVSAISVTPAAPLYFGGRGRGLGCSSGVSSRARNAFTGEVLKTAAIPPTLAIIAIRRARVLTRYTGRTRVIK